MRMSFLALAALLSSAAGAAADCTADVNEAFARLRKTGAFSMETKISNEQGTLTMSNDYVLPDRMHQRVSLSTGGGTMEMILIGDRAWSNHGQGWVPLPPEFAVKVAKQMKETVAEPPKDESSFTCLGEVELEGKKFLAFQAARSAGEAGAPGAAAPSPDAPNVQTVYLDKESGLPVRNIVTSKSDPKTRLFDGTFTLRKDLKIEAPNS
jgi:hypothetical protein